MEPRASVCQRDPGKDRLILHTGHQAPTGLQESLCKDIFGWSIDKLRIVVGHLGGGFGIRAETYPEEIVTVYAAHKQTCPVKWNGDRTQEFYGTVHGRDQLSTAELACSKDGTIQAMRILTRSNIGAYPTGPGAAIPPVVGPKILTSLYHIPCFHLEVRSFLTNTVPMGAYRGAGRPEAIYLMERLIQKTAEEMKLDPIEFRKRNFIPPESMPYTSAMGEIYDSGDFEKVLDQALEISNWNDFESRRQASHQKGRIRGRGISCYIEWTGAIWFEEVTTEAKADGSVVLYTGTQNMGQGLKTAFTQLLSEQLELPVDKIEVVQGDTDLVKGKGSVGSRSLYIGGSAVREGAEKFLEENKKLAAEALEAAKEDLVYKAGTFKVSGTNIGIGLGKIAQNQANQKVSVYSKTTLTSKSSTGCPSWPNGCQVAEIEIEPETGQVYLDSLTAYDDVGNAINPMMVEGQVHGGIVQSLGQAFMEEAVFDRDGQFANPSYMDYALPRADDVPNFKWDFYTGAPCQTNPLGAKGVGELGTVGATPAIVNAVLDALRDKGITQIDMPLTPQKVWSSLKLDSFN
jgi:carbon-monoxide dehydrogenase large subunit